MRSFLCRPVLVASLACFASLAACAGDTTGVPPTTLASQFWALTLNYHAVTLANVTPYDTLTLSATPRTQSGAPLVTTDPLVYTTSDTAVLVSASGQIRAHSNTTKTGVLIIATMKVGGAQSVTLADTAVVNVVVQSAVPRVSKFSIQPLAGDSAVRSMDSITTLPVLATGPTISDDHDQPVTPVQVYYHTPRDQYVADYVRRSLSGSSFLDVHSVGHVMLYANAYIYGRSFSDSVLLTIGYPLKKEIVMDTSMATGHPMIKGFPKDTTYLGLGGSVIWRNKLYGVANDSVDVEFFDPTQVDPFPGPLKLLTSLYLLDNCLYSVSAYVIPDGGGDVMPFVATLVPPPIDGGFIQVNDSLGNRGRSFPMAGIYPYHSRFLPGTGFLRVVSNTDLP